MENNSRVDPGIGPVVKQLLIFVQAILNHVFEWDKGLRLDLFIPAVL